MSECYTEIEQCRIEYKWTIRQFDSHLRLWENSKEVGINLKSPSFHTRMGKDMIEWRLQLNFNGSSHEFKDWISLSITCILTNRSRVWGYYNIFKISDIGEKMGVCKSNGLVEFENEKSQLVMTFLKNNSRNNNADDSLTTNSLVIICELILIADPITIPGPPPIKIPEHKLSEDYQQLYENRECSDVTFILNKEEVPAHKVILMARSPVFGAMFKHDMIENKENRVEILDMTTEVFNELLRFIYTNEVHNIDELAENLLPAADKYQLKILKTMCEESLIRTINVKNAAQTLVLADIYNCEQLIAHTIIFINKHGLDVLETLGFKIMQKSYPYLITAMYKALIVNNSVQTEREEGGLIDNNVRTVNSLRYA